MRYSRFFYRSLWAGGLLTIIGSLGFALPAAAAPASSSITSNGPNYDLTVSPVFLTLATTPGKPVSTQVKVQNNASHTVQLGVKLMEFQAVGNQGQAKLITPGPNDPSAKWVSFSTNSITAQPGVFNTVTVNIHPPRLSAFGYYYAVVFTQGNTNTPAQNVTSVSGSSAVLLLLDVQVPGEKRQITVSNFMPTHKVYEFLPATFDITAKNTGDIFGAPTGDVYISRGQKQPIATVPVNEAQNNILPGSSRLFTSSWDDGFPAHVVKRVNGQVVTGSNGQPETELSWNVSQLKNFRFGKYTAHLTLVYNNGTQDVPVDAETTFWVIPWKIMLVILVLLILIGYGLFSLLRRSARLSSRLLRRKSKPPKTES